MKRRGIRRILCIAAAVATMAAGCGKADGGTSDNGTSEAAHYTDADDLEQAGLGGLAMLYDNTVWTLDESQGSDSSFAFTSQNGALLGVSCSREAYYQHPLDMIEMTKQLSAGYEDFQEVEAPTPVTVQDEEWYEWTYRYVENGVETMALQRFYGKNYYAYVMSYIAEADKFEEDKSEALKVMNSAVMNVPDNTEAEEKAKEFLVGEWDLGDAGYLVMNEDGTYAWYMDSSKDENNMHRGTYYGDVSNDTLGFGEGEGIYFVLFPEVLYTDGQEGMTASAKYDYAVSLEQQADGSYPMVNPSTFAMYSMLKQ